MRKNIKVALLGGDLRQISVAKSLANDGFSVDLWGIAPPFCSQQNGFSVSSDWGATISACRVLILPLPASGDGIHISCPLLNENVELKLSKVLDLLPGDTLILGGKFSPSVKKMIADKGFRCIDYFQKEELQIKNAVPTVEGALAIAMNELPVTLSGAKTAVIGYGRIGKVLASKLKLLDANVTVAARKGADIALIESNGMSALPIYMKDGKNSLEVLADGYDVIFNTVPAWVVDANIIKKMPKETLFIDLASAPGGIDMQAAKQQGLSVIWALSLPGKCSPFTAGQIIAQTARQILIEEGITQ